MRAYELMIIFRAETEESAVQAMINRLGELSIEAGGTLEKIDKWGVRRFAFEIKHQWEGFYVVLEFIAPNALDEIDRTLRLADEVIRHKFMRLPVPEAHKRGLAAVSV
jgi:small subunit ribosomal protein S6